MVRYTPDEIKAKFPHPTLQMVEGEPDYAAINTIMQQLYKNAATIPSSLGGGAHGYRVGHGTHAVLQPLSNCI
eukprot:14429991-Ditylum_brightwellii.AAC.1